MRGADSSKRKRAKDSIHANVPARLDRKINKPEQIATIVEGIYFRFHQEKEGGGKEDNSPIRPVSASRVHYPFSGGRKERSKVEMAGNGHRFGRLENLRAHREYRGKNSRTARRAAPSLTNEDPG